METNAYLRGKNQATDRKNHLGYLAKSRETILDEFNFIVNIILISNPGFSALKKSQVHKVPSD